MAGLVGSERIAVFVERRIVFGDHFLFRGEDREAVPGLEVLEDHVPKERGLARAGFADHVDMPLPECLRQPDRDV